jgi:hypothetical protein
MKDFWALEVDTSWLFERQRQEDQESSREAQSSQLARTLSQK